MYSAAQAGTVHLGHAVFGNQSTLQCTARKATMCVAWIGASVTAYNTTGSPCVRIATVVSRQAGTLKQKK